MVYEGTKILQEKIFESIWIQPAAGDAGGSLGAALALAVSSNAILFSYL